MEKVLTKDGVKERIIKEIESEICKFEKEIEDEKKKKEIFKMELLIARKTAQKMDINPLEEKILDEIKEVAIEEIEETKYAIQFADEEIANLEFKINYLQAKLSILKNPSFYIDKA